MDCVGVSLRVTDPAAFRSVRTGVSLLYKILELHPGKVAFPPSHWSVKPHISYLSGCDAFEGELPPLDKLLDSWEADSGKFRERKQKYHIYNE
jgi:uncharacterized protein YbbC (DUF1343 family)